MPKKSWALEFYLSDTIKYTFIINVYLMVDRCYLFVQSKMCQRHIDLG
jgi:hypothetical protein